MPQPRISKLAQQRIVKNSDEAHNVVLPVAPPPTDPAAIEAADRERLQLAKRYADEEAAAQLQLAGTPVAKTPVVLEDEIAQRALELASEEAARRTNNKERHRAINIPWLAPFEARLAAAKKEMKALREQHLIKLQVLKDIAVEPLVRGYKWKITPGSSVTGAQRAALLQRAAAQGVEALAHKFMVSDDAIRRMRASASSDVESQEVRMARDHVRKSVATSESSVASAKQAVAAVTKLHEQLMKDLAEATKIENPTPVPEVEWLPTRKITQAEAEANAMASEDRPVFDALPENRSGGKVVGFTGGA